jgi:NlpC/P60 family putative phage cell wall peptidase
MVTRQQIVSEARRWRGTPFQHQGRLRGVGVDCVGLVLCVARDLGLGDWCEDYNAYSSQPVSDAVLTECRRRLLEKTVSMTLPGDVLCFRLPRFGTHVGIVTGCMGFPGIVHAYSGGPGRVVEHFVDAKWRRRIAAAFAFPGLK